MFDLQNGLIFLAATVGGCHCYDRTPPAPRRPTEPLSLLYFDWARYSPGAGFTRSDSRAIEIDFERHQVRSIVESVKAPQPMRSPLGPLGAQPWADPPAKREAEIRRALVVWLDTEPQRKCYLMRAYGSRESSYTEQLIAKTTSGDYAVHVNPESKRRDELDCAPGPAYRPLIDELFRVE